jgi:hypothetical protein
METGGGEEIKGKGIWGNGKRGILGTKREGLQKRNGRE